MLRKLYILNWQKSEDGVESHNPWPDVLSTTHDIMATVFAQLNNIYGPLIRDQEVLSFLMEVDLKALTHLFLFLFFQKKKSCFIFLMQCLGTSPGRVLSFLKKKLQGLV